MKKQNFLEKFVKFFEELVGSERLQLWDLLSSLRGLDRGEGDAFFLELKFLVTARLRYEIFGISSMSCKVFIAKNRENAFEQIALYAPVDALPFIRVNIIKSAKKQWEQSSSHFREHIRKALIVLQKMSNVNLDDILEITGSE